MAFPLIIAYQKRREENRNRRWSKRKKKKDTLRERCLFEFEEEMGKKELSRAGKLKDRKEKGKKKVNYYCSGMGWVSVSLSNFISLFLKLFWDLQIEWQKTEWMNEVWWWREKKRLRSFFFCCCWFWLMFGRKGKDLWEFGAGWQAKSLLKGEKKIGWRWHRPCWPFCFCLNGFLLIRATFFISFSFYFFSIFIIFFFSFIYLTAYLIRKIKLR